MLPWPHFGELNPSPEASLHPDGAQGAGKDEDGGAFVHGKEWRDVCLQLLALLRCFPDFIFLHVSQTGSRGPKFVKLSSNLSVLFA